MITYKNANKKERSSFIDLFEMVDFHTEIEFNRFLKDCEK